MSLASVDRKLLKVVPEPLVPPAADTRFWKLCSRLVRVESVVLDAVEAVADEVLCELEVANFCIRLCRSLPAWCLPPLEATEAVPLAPSLDEVLDWVTPPAFCACSAANKLCRNCCSACCVSELEVVPEACNATSGTKR